MAEQIKKLWKPFLVLFVVAFFAINWNQTSWIFNYKVISGYASGIFVRIGQGGIIGGNTALADVGEYSTRENGIEIPALGISAPMTVNQDLNNNGVYDALNNGVVYYPGSALPGQLGQTTILGHSAPPGWPKIKYEWVFSGLQDLSKGDQIIVYYNNRKLTYTVTDIIFLDRGETVPILTNNKSSVILISCWPPGKNIRRIGIVAQLQT